MVPVPRAIDYLEDVAIDRLTKEHVLDEARRVLHPPYGKCQVCEHEPFTAVRNRGPELALDSVRGSMSLLKV